MNIIEIAKTVAPSVQDDNVEGCEHMYAYFDNGYIVSTLRGLHPLTGLTFGEPGGAFQAAVLVETGFGMPVPALDFDVVDVTTEEQFKTLLEDIKGRDKAPEPSMADLLSVLNAIG